MSAVVEAPKLSQSAASEGSSERTTSRSPLAARPWIVPLAFCVLGLGIYSNSIAGVFLLDDWLHIVENPMIESVSKTLANVGRGGRPTIMATLAINYQISGRDPWSYHVFNVAIHIANACLLYALLSRMLRSGRLGDSLRRRAEAMAFVVALIWLVHPLCTQAVTYVIQRCESLMGFFLLLTLCCVWRGAESERKGWYAGAAAACVLGMGCKEVMFVVPVLALLMDRIYLADSWRETLSRRWAMHALLALSWLVLFRSILEGLFLAAGGATPDPEAASMPSLSDDWFPTPSPIAYARSQPGVILHYLRLAIIPYPLNFDYLWPEASVREAILPSLVAGTLVAASLWALLRRPAWGFWGAWFFLILAPTSSIVPIYDLAVEHRMYMPLIAVVFLATTAADALLRRWGTKPELALAGAAAACFCTLTVLRNEDYRSNVRLWQTVVERAPNNPRGHNNLAAYLRNLGKKTEAQSHFEKAVELMPRYPTALTNLGELLEAQGKFSEAENRYRASLAYLPNNPRTKLGLSTALINQGRLDEALAQLTELAKSRPDDPDLLYNKAGALRAKGRVGEAAALYERLRDSAPNKGDVRSQLGLTYLESSKGDDAVRECRKAVELEPNSLIFRVHLALAQVELGLLFDAQQTCAQLHRMEANWVGQVNDLARNMATGNQVRLDPGRAVRYARLASFASNNHPETLDTLALAQAEAGRFEEAAATAQRALAAAAGSGNQSLANAIRARLDRYRMKQTAAP